MEDRKTKLRKIKRHRHGIYYIPKRCRKWRRFFIKTAESVLPNYRKNTLEELKSHIENNFGKWRERFMCDLIGEPVHMPYQVPTLQSFFDCFKNYDINLKKECL